MKHLIMLIISYIFWSHYFNIKAYLVFIMCYSCMAFKKVMALLHNVHNESCRICSNSNKTPLETIACGC